MKAEEIIDCLEEISRMVYRLYEDEIYCQVMDKAIKAVKKTLPQKIKRDPFGAECPNCGGRVTLPSAYTFGGKKVDICCDYCYSCGQALDWSEE